MRIGRSSIRNDGYTMGKDQKTINKAETVKDIGVTFDSSLNFEAHKIMSEQINKANSMIGIILRTFEYLDDKCLSTVFKSCPTTYRVCKLGMGSIFNETHNST